MKKYGAYALISQALESRFFLHQNNLTWVRALKSSDLVCATSNSECKMVITPDDNITIFLTEHDRHAGRYEVLQTHADVRDWKTKETTNAEREIELFGQYAQSKAIFAHRNSEIVRLEGIFDPQKNPTWSNLRLDLIVPTPYVPKNLPKVPRNKIAELRIRIEKMFNIGQVANRLQNGVSIWSLLKTVDPDMKTMLESAFLRNNAIMRAQLLRMDDTVIWQAVAITYSSPTSLIDSCRPQLYDAMGLREGQTAKTFSIEPQQAPEQLSLDLEVL